MEFRHHPDGFIYVAGLQMPLAEFLLDEPGYPGLPDGVAGFEYFSDGKHWSYAANGDAFGPVLAKKVLDAYIAKAAIYEANQAAREAAALAALPVPEKGDLQALKEALILKGVVSAAEIDAAKV